MEFQQMDLSKDGAAESASRREKSIELWSFGFKYGAMQADAIIDVRFLPNPYYDDSLRFFTGKHPRCAAYVLQHESCRGFTRNLAGCILAMRESAEVRTRPVLRVAVGCTGGQHRSVAVIEELARLLRAGDTRGGHVQVEVHHRDAAKWVLSDRPACG